jgi:hypothetical protein
MDSLAQQCLKQSLKITSLASIQVLLILSSIMQFRGNLKASRAYIGQLTRMAYNLGLHTSNYYDHKLIFSRVIIANYNISGKLKIYPNYLAESTTNQDGIFFDLFPTIEDFPPDLKSIGINLKKLNLILKLSFLTQRFSKHCMTSINLIKSDNQEKAVRQLELNLKLLESSFSRVIIDANELTLEYGEFENFIKEFNMEMYLFYYDISLGLLNEYTNLNLAQAQLTPIRSKILQICNQMTDNILKRSKPNSTELDPNLEYYSYLVTLHNYKLINHLPAAQKFEIFMNSLLIIDRLKLNFNTENNLNLLVLMSGIKIIRNKFNY